MAGHVYLIGSPIFKWYKIGKSSNAAIRIADLGILLPFRIEVIAVWKAKNHHVLERLLHEKYTSARINGEWFSFTDGQVRDIVHELQTATTSAAIGFSNIETDLGPEGKIIKIRFKAGQNLTDAEREERKKQAIAKRTTRPKCPSCGRCIDPHKTSSCA